MNMIKVRGPAIDVSLASTTGHTVIVLAGEETTIPAILATEATARGCAILDEGTVQPSPIVKLDPVDMRNAGFAEKVKDAIEQVMDTGTASDVDTNGKPTAAALSRIVDKRVTAQDRDAAWAEVSSMYTGEKD